MPVQTPQWTEFLSCPICYNEFEPAVRCPISLGCGHTLCKHCLAKLQRKQCPFDQTAIALDVSLLPVNHALLQLVGGAVPPEPTSLPPAGIPKEEANNYEAAKTCIEELALYLKASSQGASVLSRPMQRKLVTLLNCQLVEAEGRVRAMRAARSLGERSVTELILQHQNPGQLSANLWAAVRARGCQFLGPAMQEEVLRLVLLALEDASALSRKVLVMFVVQRMAAQYPQASKTSIGHVVQLLYRASCFKVSKRDGDSSLMQLKEEFRTYDALRREHDAQIVQIATEAGLRIAPEQWSSLLYGDTAHKSHMQSIIDKLQTPQSFSQSVQELVIALQRTGDPGNLSVLRPNLELLAAIDATPDAGVPCWEELRSSLEAAKQVVKGLVEFIHHYGSARKLPEERHLNVKYKTSMCRDLAQRGSCPRGNNCTFAHSHEEMEKFRAKNKKAATTPTSIREPTRNPPSSSIESLASPSSPPNGLVANDTDYQDQSLSPYLKEGNINSEPTNFASPPQRAFTQPTAILCTESIIVMPPTVMTSTTKVLDMNQALYSPWTSGHLFNYASTKTDDKKPNRAGFYPSEKDEFIPFGAPLVSKYGPISRTARMKGLTASIQVNAGAQELTSPTSVVRHPLPSATLYTSTAGLAVPTMAIIPSDSYHQVMVAFDCSTSPLSQSLSDTDVTQHQFSEVQISKEARNNISRRPIHEELLALGRSLQEKEKLSTTKVIVKGCSKVPTSIGPWPTQSLVENIHREEDPSDQEEMLTIGQKLMQELEQDDWQDEQQA